MKAIRIISCSRSFYWYTKWIGHLVPYVREEGDVFWSREEAGYLNFVEKYDAEVVEVDDHTIMYTLWK